MLSITIYEQKSNCYGCGACRNSCPVNAITMQPDEEGFLYPQVNAILCSGCGICKAVCPFYQNFNGPAVYSQKIFAVKHRDEAIRAKSTSGGFFTSLSDFILEKGGVIYGAAFDENLRVCHKRAETSQKRDEILGSKYVQSELGLLYQRIKKDLSDHKRVLFTGTPCQTAGLRSYLDRTDMENLILCDLVCHGVPSSLIWEEYKKFAQRKEGHPLIAHDFRTKKNGWHAMTSRNIFRNCKEDSGSLLSQLHKNLFLSNLILRPCCYNCKFASFSRCSDITMGDFWGINQSMPEFDDNKGVSLILLNTSKGEELFNDIREKLEIRESSAANCLQRNLQLPSEYPPNRDEFWKDYYKHGYLHILRKYAGYTIFHQLLRLLHTLLKNIGLLRFIKKLLHR